MRSRIEFAGAGGMTEVGMGDGVSPAKLVASEGGHYPYSRRNDKKNRDPTQNTVVEDAVNEPLRDDGIPDLTTLSS